MLPRKKQNKKQKPKKIKESKENPPATIHFSKHIKSMKNQGLVAESP